MLAVPAKLSDKGTDWATGLHKYVKSTYSKRQAEVHRSQYQAVAQLRKRVEAIGQVSETTADAAKELLVRYDRTLQAMEQRFDMPQLKVQFAWKDAFKPYMKQSEADTRFERVAIFFNLAAVVSFSAIAQKRSDAEGIRLACRQFQQAAGLLEAVTSMVSSTPWANTVTPDISPTTLQTLQTLMLAQAQRCYYEKADADGLSPALLCKIASQVSTFYADVHAALCTSCKEHVDSSWAEVVGCNQKMFEALTQFHAAAQHASAFEFGLQVARLTHAVGRLKEAVALAKNTAPRIRQVYEEALAKVSWAHQQAVKDNSSVYMEPVPPFSSLPVIGGKCIVKPLPMPELEEAASPSRKDDLFVQLVPHAVQSLLEECATRMQQQREALYLRLEATVENGQQRLFSLDLPHALQAVEAAGSESEQDVPVDLAEQIRRIHANGGDEAVRASLGQLQELSAQCDETLARIQTSVTQVEEIDADMRKEHGAKWQVSSSSAVATAEATKDLESYNARLQEARTANSTLAERYAERRADLQLLEMPLEILNQQVPASAGTAVADHEATRALRVALDALDAHCRGREALLARFVDTRCVTRQVRIERGSAKIGITVSDNKNVGVEVDAVIPDGLAAQAGITIGDVLVSVNGKLCRNHKQAVKLIDGSAAQVDLVVQQQPYDQALVDSLVYRGQTPAEVIVTEHLSAFEPHEVEGAAFIAEHGVLLDAIASANEAFTNACIAENEHAVSARQAYFKDLNQAVTLHNQLSSQMVEGIAFFSSAVEKLAEVHAKVCDLATAIALERQDLEEQLTAATVASLKRQDTVAMPLPPPSFEAAIAMAPPPPPPPPQTPQDESALVKLMEMGFSRAQAVGALAHSQGEVSGALGLLLGATDRSGGGWGVADETATDDSTPVGAAGAAGAAGTTQTVPRPAVSRHASGSFQLPSTLPPKVQTLVDMGFTKEQAAAALGMADGNVEAATAALLASPPPPPSHPPPSSTMPLSQPGAIPIVAASAVPPPAAPPPTVPPVPVPESQLPVMGTAVPVPSAGATADVSELVGMGFSAEAAAEALRRCNGAMHDAVQLLLDSPDLLPSVAAASAPVGEPVSMSTPLPVPAAMMSTSASVPSSQVRLLMDMGFGLPESEAALRQANGDHEQAVHLLLGGNVAATSTDPAPGWPSAPSVPLAVPVVVPPVVPPSGSVALPVAAPPPYDGAYQGNRAAAPSPAARWDLD